MMPFSASVLRKVVLTDTESKTASTATTPASTARSLIGMPSLSKVSCSFGSISLGRSASFLGAA